MKILEKALGFDPKTMKLRTELIAGVTTFLTMSYILAVNPSILMTTGMSQGALFTATALPIRFARQWAIRGKTRSPFCSSRALYSS